MSAYDLYYWSVPFHGQFVLAALAYAGKTWTEGGDAAISKLMKGPRVSAAVVGAAFSKGRFDLATGQAGR